MIKLVLWYVRKPGLTLAEATEGNHRVHGGLVKQGPEDFQSAVLRYTQSYPFDAAYGRTGAKNFDGVSELTYESPEALRANLQHPHYREIVQPDGANFADESFNVVHLATEENVHPPVPGDGIKVLRWLQAPAGTDPDEFERFWTDSFENEISNLDGLLGYTRSRVPTGAPVINGQPPTAFDTIWLDGHQDVPGFQEYTRKFFTDGQEQGVLEPAQCFYLFCTERRVLDTLG